MPAIIRDTRMVTMDIALAIEVPIEPEMTLYIIQRVTHGRLKSLIRRGSCCQKPTMAKIEPTVGRRLYTPPQSKREHPTVKATKKIGTRM